MSLQKKSQESITKDPADKDPYTTKFKGNAESGARDKLKATIPEPIIAFLEIQSGDKLDWRMDMQNGERVAIVRKSSYLSNVKPKLDNSIKASIAMEEAIDSYLKDHGNKKLVTSE
jgi:hypothetical protein